MIQQLLNHTNVINAIVSMLLFNSLEHIHTTNIQKYIAKTVKSKYQYPKLKFIS